MEQVYWCAWPLNMRVNHTACLCSGQEVLCLLNAYCLIPSPNKVHVYVQALFRGSHWGSEGRFV